MLSKSADFLLLPLIDRFEAAWQKGEPLAVWEFLSSLDTSEEESNGVNRAVLARELVKIDLEYRWRLSPQSEGRSEPADALRCLTLENYAAECPELGSSAELPSDLIAEEYRVRQLWGDHPARDVFLAQFPGRADGLIGLLTEIDAELASLRQPDTEEPNAEHLTLASPVVPATASVAEVPFPIREIKGYELIDELGRGGMGVVYRARQVGLGRFVALKVLQSGSLAGKDERARFHREAHAVARLQHPNIVQIFATGEYNGQPFLVMELVEGGTLAKRIAGNPLPARAAAHLVERLVRAVDYAHQHGIVHRDLKPSNVLVGQDDEPKIADFGLAKCLELAAHEAGPTLEEYRTQTGAILGTPPYLAPEQVGGAKHEVGPASDIYALGTILYEATTGQPPFKAATIVETLELIRSTEPITPRRLQPLLPRDLETIVLKAMAKEPAGRYMSAQAMAEDLHLFLAGRTILARRSTTGEQLWRWCKRNPVIAGLNALAATLAIVIAIVSTAAAYRNGRLAEQLKDQRDETARNLVQAKKAQAETGEALAEAEAVNAFLTEDLLGQADPDANARDKKVTVEELLREAAGQIEGNVKFAGRPEVEATLRLTLGKTFFKLSDLAEGEKHLRRAVDLRRQSLGPDDPRTLAAQEALADFLNRGPARPAEAVPLALQTWQGRTRILGPEHRDTLDSLNTYAGCLQTAGQGEQAIPLLRECLAARLRTLGPRHEDTLVSMNNLAVVLMRYGDYSEAIPLLREAVEARRPAGPETKLALSASNLGLCLITVGQLDEADRLLRESLKRADERLEDHQETDRLRWFQIRVWLEQGQVDRAVALGRQAIDLRRRIYPAGHWMIAPALMDLGRGLVLQNRFDEAEVKLCESLSIFARTQSFFPHYPAWSECWYGASLVGQRRYAEAKPHLLAAEKGLREARTTPRGHYRQAVEQLVKLYEAWCKPDEATRWRTTLTALNDAQGPPESHGGNTRGSGREKFEVPPIAPR
jgi:serine/threonine protein kinase/tetratricopeptide (TPR) repeat protein